VRVAYLLRMAQAGPPPNDRKRVKVYELKNNDWYDRGTGFCVGQMVNVSAGRILFHAHSLCALFARL
jgi:hypothetical protein